MSPLGESCRRPPPCTPIFTLWLSVCVLSGLHLWLPTVQLKTSQGAAAHYMYFVRAVSAAFPGFPLLRVPTGVISLCPKNFPLQVIL